MSTAFRCRARASRPRPTRLRLLAGGMGYPVVMKIVSPDILHKTEAGGVIVGVKSDEEARAAYDHDPRQRPGLQGRRPDRGRPGPADAQGRHRGHRRRDHRQELRQARRLRARRRPRRGLEGHHLPPRPGDQGRRLLHARRHQGPGDAARRARRRSGQPRGARRRDRQGVRNSSAISPRSSSST